MKVLVILNAQSGTNLRSGAQTTLQSLTAAFEKQDIIAEIELADGGNLTQIAERAVGRAKRREFDAVVVGGGDGSVRTLAVALAGSDIALGVLPLGTLNHFAKDLGIPLEIGKAIGVIAERRLAKVDVGDVNGEAFVNNSSIGIYPEMVLDRGRRQQMHGVSKWVAAVLAFFRVMRSFRRWRFTVRAAGTTEAVRTPCLLVGNNQYGTNVFNLGRREQLDGGELWLYVAKTRRPLEFIVMAARMALGAMNLERDLSILKVASAEIESQAKRIPVALDGEVMMLNLPLRYRIRPRALCLFRATTPSPM